MGETPHSVAAVSQSKDQVMRTYLLMKFTLVEATLGSGPVTRGMLRRRAVELAAMDGRRAQDTSMAEWVQAKQEMFSEHQQDQETLECALH
jgi:hypothetical protein